MPSPYSSVGHFDSIYDPTENLINNIIRASNNSQHLTSEAEMPQCSICGQVTADLKRGENDKYYCDECIKTHSLVQCAAEHCHKYLQQDEIFLSGVGYLCKEHLEKNYDFCSCCGSFEKKKYLNKLSDGKKICNYCLSQNYFICESCGEVHKLEDSCEVTVNGSKQKICKNCRERFYTNCPICGSLENVNKINHIRYIDQNGKKKEVAVCRNCLDDKFKRCDNCGNYFHKDTKFKDDNTICECCYYSRKIIHEYSFKPRVIPKSAAAESKKLLFGIENEIELKFRSPEIDHYRDSENREWTIPTESGQINVDYPRYIAYKIDSAIPGLFYQKRDGSIHFGMEIVSHPATIEFWRSQEENIEKLFSFLREEGTAGDKAPTVGMHIHITRKDMNRPHQNSFSALIYSHKDNIEKLAGRPSNGYTKMIPLPNSAKDDDEKKIFEKNIINNHDRYSAVNWNNSNTVELRMFQSTLKTDIFIGNIEFAHALYMFTKERTVLECINDESWDNFKNFIEEKEYNFLKQLFITRSLMGIR